MRDILDILEEWVSEQKAVAIATVVNTWGSSPRKTGSKLAVRSDGAMAGSVSGGCIEGAVAETAMKIIAGAPPQLLKFGVSDNEAWDVGLACGGTIEVFVQTLDVGLFTQAASQIKTDQTIALISCIEGAEDLIGKQVLVDPQGDPIAGDQGLLRDLSRSGLQNAISRRECGRLETASVTDRAFFLDIIAAPSQLVLIGGVHISIALAQLAKVLGYKVIVVDPRRLFATDDRFPAVDKLIRSWPQDAYKQIDLNSETAIAVLTHDPKIDDPAIIAALEKPVFYIGVLGSPTTHTKRLERLRKAGCSEGQLAKLHAPIGLDLGAQSPEEIALTIIAEILAVHSGKST
jgi:xanthine dehydrogenase accessory factor